MAMTILRYMAAAWLAFMGSIAIFMLYNELMNPMWGRQAKELFPAPPPWYIDAAVAIAALACYYLAYRLIFRVGNKRVRKKKEETD